LEWTPNMSIADIYCTKQQFKKDPPITGYHIESSNCTVMEAFAHNYHRT
jgi:hypothetical protein